VVHLQQPPLQQPLQQHMLMVLHRQRQPQQAPPLQQRLLAANLRLQ
jgi:hypothetical protein